MSIVLEIKLHSGNYNEEVFMFFKLLYTVRYMLYYQAHGQKKFVIIFLKNPFEIAAISHISLALSIDH